MRDHFGCNLNQAILARGHKTFVGETMFFLQMSTEEGSQIDPGSDLHPFMVAASGETYNLSAVTNFGEEGFIKTEI